MDMQAVKLAILVMVVAAFAGCDVESTPRGRELPEVGQTEAAIIGSDGGSVVLGDTTLAVPPAALTEDVEIRITVVDGDAPAAFTAYSPRFRFEPAGLQFQEPITITLPFDGYDDAATIFWTSRSTGSFMALQTTVADGQATARVAHFSEAFVGSGCSGDDCCSPANGELDVVLLVDNSNSMSEEQAALAEEIPQLARILATGDLDDDGTQDFPALTSVRVGVLSSDMGTAGYTIMTCSEPMHGDDGVLRTAGNSDIPGCDMSYPPFAEFGADDSAAAVDAFVQHVQCVGILGVGGCGFEQQLEATLKAVTPASSPVRFMGDTTGHGDDANAGFLRTDSIVAYIVLTDEGDCSTPNAELFNPARDDYGTMNNRCAISSDELHPVTRYIDGLQAVRSDPNDVIFGLVGGVPADLVADPDSVDLDAVLADPRMIPTVDPTNPSNLLHSCESARGAAFPPQRMVQVAQGFGANGVVQSICAPDFSPTVAAILDRVASRARGECL